MVFDFCVFLNYEINLHLKVEFAHSSSRWQSDSLIPNLLSHTRSSLFCIMCYLCLKWMLYKTSNANKFDLGVCFGFAFECEDVWHFENQSSHNNKKIFKLQLLYIFIVFQICTGQYGSPYPHVVPDHLKCDQCYMLKR